MADPISALLFFQGLGLSSAAAAFIATNLVTIALTVGTLTYGNYQRRKAKQKARDAFNASLEDRLVMVATADGARSRVYGRVRNCDGVLFKATRGTNSEFYTILVALAGHEIDAVEQVYFGDEPVTLDVDGYVLTAPWFKGENNSDFGQFSVAGDGTGQITLPYTPIANSIWITINTGSESQTLVESYSVNGTQVSVTGQPAGTASISYQYSTGKSYARVRAYYGTAAQDLSAEMVADFPALCQASDKFKGIALLRLDLEYSQDAFPSGVPQVSAVIRGAKCYDPRSGLTVWTQNPAIIARDWVRYAYGGNTTSLSDATITAAANVCDVDTAFVSPAGTVTMDAYQCGIVCKLDSDPTAALSEIVESMAGRWGWAGGTLKIVAGAYRAPVDTITEDWVSDASDVIITPSPPRSELVNTYRATISNRDNKYQAEPAPPLIASTYVTADGQQLDAEITMAGVTSIQHAQHISGILLRDARQSLVVQLPCNLRAWKLELFDTVQVTIARFGWSAKLFEVMGWKFGLGGGVLLTLKEANSTVYDVDAGFADLGNDDNSDLPSAWQVPDIVGVSISSGTAELTDGSIITRTRVSWSAVSDAAVTQAGRVEVQYIELGTTVSGDWPGQLESGNATETIITGLVTGSVYVFRLRAINGAGVRGNWSVHEGGLISLPPDVTADLSSFDPYLTYDFVNSADSWTVSGITTTLNANSITLDSTGTDPQFISPTTSIIGGTYDKVRVRLKRTAGTEWQGTLYYATGGHSYSESYKVTVPDTTTSSYLTLEWDMSGTADWVASTITGLRLDLGNTAADTFVVDWVSVGRSGAGISIKTFAQASAPTASAVGDLWIDTDDKNKLYRWSGTAWVLVRDSDITLALSNAAAAQATADGKIDSFWQTNAPGSALEGDIWFDTDDGYKQYRWTSGAWVVAADTRIGTAISNAATAQATADGKVLTWVQTTAPTASAVGDLWFDSDDGYKPYRWNGGSWVMIQDGDITEAFSTASAAQATADSKIISYYQTTAPASGSEGDLWFDTDDGYKQYRRTGGVWVIAADTRIGTAINNAASAQSTADGKIVSFIQPTAPYAEAVGDLWFDSDDGYKLYRAGAPGNANWTAYQYGTGAIADNAVTTIKLPVYASSLPLSAYTVGSITVNTAWTTVAAVAITVNSPESSAPVAVWAGCNVITQFDEFDGSPVLHMRVYRDSAVWVSETDVAGGQQHADGMQATPPAIDTPGVGTHTYEFQLRASSGAVYASFRGLIVVLLKR